MMDMRSYDPYNSLLGYHSVVSMYLDGKLTDWQLYYWLFVKQRRRRWI